MSSQFLSGYNLDYLYNQVRVNIITERKMAKTRVSPAQSIRGS